jgi:hypothetical protein
MPKHREWYIFLKPLGQLVSKSIDQELLLKQIFCKKSQIAHFGGPEQNSADMDIETDRCTHRKNFIL